ncbi:MAG: hypothetical protein IJA30_01945 [Bacilli bacterium]|nr:hypothetical protein [Bacilli bacterium]
MNEGKKLTIQMALFFLVTFVLFGTIIIKEKQNIIFLPKIENSISKYMNDTYQDLSLEKDKVTEENNVFTMKVKNIKNKNHYFYIKYSNKKITDTYKTDYLEGKTILNHLSTKLEKDIYKETNITYKVSFDNKFNNYSEKVQKLLLEENIKTLKVYTIEKEITTSWEINNITKTISDTMTTLEKKQFTPKNYTFIITNEKDITQSIKINNLKSSLINENKLQTIISDIISNNKSSILTENKITYEYLN